MKDNDLLYLLIGGAVAYFLFTKKGTEKSLQDMLPSQEDLADSNLPPMGNAGNGGLNLPPNMDLPSLTPTLPNSMTIEEALNSGNIFPIIKTPVIIGGVSSLTAPSGETKPSTSVGGVSSIYVPPSSLDPTKTKTEEMLTTPTIVGGTKDAPSLTDSLGSQSSLPSSSGTTTPTTIGGVSAIFVPSPLDPTKIKTEEMLTTPTIVGGVKDAPSLTADTLTMGSTSGTTTTTTSPTTTVSSPSTGLTSPTASSSTSTLTSPLKTSTTTSTSGSGTNFLNVVGQCGSSFSIPNNDKEGSYTNYWFDGKNFYTQTISPLIRTIAVKISSDAYMEGCKRLESFQNQSRQFVSM